MTKNRSVSSFCKYTAYGFSALLVLGAGCGNDTSAGAAPGATYNAAKPAAEAPSRDYLFRYAGTGAGSDQDLRLARAFTDEQGITHNRFQQMVGNVPVFGGEAIVHVNQDGSLQVITDSLLRNVRVGTSPALAAADAIRAAVADFGGEQRLTDKPKADLVVLRRGDQDHLTYRIQLRRLDGTEETSMPVVFVDAHSGEIVWKYDNLQTVAGTGSSLYSGTVSIETTLNGSSYYMEENTTVATNVYRRIGTFDNRNTTGSTYRFSNASNSWTGSTQRAGVDAHYGARAVWDYYRNVHGRYGINNAGGPGYYSWVSGSTTALISSRVHYGSRYNNAFWDGQTMNYGDGDGSTFSPLVTLDIAGHEMTHGVTQYTANLTYSGESGALNESMSDVFGAMVERYRRGVSPNTQTWQIGEQAYTPSTSGDALRYMNAPHSGSQPDHYSERYTGTSDNGGVHTNSGIPNYVFYLTSQGGTHHMGGSVTGIGYSAAERIWYRALTSYMTASTNMKGARTATLSAASALYGSGSAQYNSVAQAWTVCGVN